MTELTAWLKTAGGPVALTPWRRASPDAEEVTLHLRDATFDVAGWLAPSQRPFYAAHRGGGRHWPEMTMHAYQSSAAWGAKALEVSVARSSDGVWVCSHDTNLDRMCGTSGYNISAHPWSEISGFTVTAQFTDTPSQPRRPIARLEQVLDAFAGTHVVLIENKSGTNHTALLDLMDTYTDSTDHLVWKCFYTGSVAADTARGRGYKAWGYYYEDSVVAADDTQDSFDILGMDYDADQDAWDEIKAFGKPVMGHVIDAPPQAVTAFAKGADGLMVSCVRDVIPPLTF